MFILSNRATKAIAETPGIRPKLCLALGVSEQTIYLTYTNNEPNNNLTKYAALKVILEETGLPLDKLLLEVKSLVKTM